MLFGHSNAKVGKTNLLIGRGGGIYALGCVLEAPTMFEFPGEFVLQRFPGRLVYKHDSWCSGFKLSLFTEFPRLTFGNFSGTPYATSEVFCLGVSAKEVTETSTRPVRCGSCP
jgi:hypothetical protein